MNKDKEKYLSHKRSLTAEQMLDEELIMCHLGTLDSYQSPYDALRELVNFYIDIERLDESKYQKTTKGL